MKSVANVSYPAETTLIWQTCRTQHQTWATALVQSEQEIDQLLNLLAELPHENYRSLNHQALAYSQALNRLKGQIHHLRLDVVCAGVGCSTPAPLVPCPDPHFVSSSIMGNTLIASVATEYERLKNRCHAFLSELMRLNLI